MLEANTVMTSLAVTDLERAREFYERKLGLKKREGALPGADAVYEVKDGSGFFLYRRDAPPTTDVTSMGFLVADFDRTIEELKGAGVKLEDIDVPGVKTENGIARMDDVQVAWFKDPDGNILAVSSDPR